MAYHVESSPRGHRSLPTMSIVFGIFFMLFLIDSVIELALSSSSVSWLSDIDRSTPFRFTVDGKKYPLSGHPRHFIVDQVYATNAAAVFAVGIVGLGSMAAITMREYASRALTGCPATFSRYCYYVWLSLSIPSLILTGVALAYVFAVANSQKAQTISTALAVNENGRPYARGTWTPQGWFSAVLRLELVRGREEIVKSITIMKGMQYNLIPSE
ncbi:hypothetical protein F5B18DRAFT_619945 [Nemania serpens]|nr:hypothetical protein F5B18DRAFT_619945 [Nemania serpens]